MADIYGDLRNNDVFSAAFLKALGALWAAGTEATLTRYLA